MNVVQWVSKPRATSAAGIIFSNKRQWAAEQLLRAPSPAAFQRRLAAGSLRKMLEDRSKVAALQGVTMMKLK